MRTKTIIEFLEKLPKPYLTFFGFLLVLAIGSLDTITTYDISVAALYLLPIILIAWFEGGIPAVLTAIFSAVTWAVSDLVSGHMYSRVGVRIWNAMMVLGVFLTVAYSITTIKKLTIRGRTHASTDELTGVANIKMFYERARAEISRSAANKLPLTLAYVAIDNLQNVNDTLGHIAGDYLLHEAAHIMSSTLRSTDVISRLGGAKFAVLMPEIKNEDAGAILYIVQERLSGMAKKNRWPVTFRLGVVTCDGPTCTIDRIIGVAEDLLNDAGKTGSNTVKSRVLDLAAGE